MRLALAFAWFGLFWGSFAVATYDLERFLGTGDAGFGALLTVALAAGVVANLGGGSLARRFGSQRLLVAALLAFSCLELVLAASGLPLLFAAVFVVTAGGSGLLDLSINVAGTARYSAEPGRLARLHALFNLGALGGAGVQAGLSAAGLSWRWAWVAFGLLGLPLALASRADTQPEAGGVEGSSSPLVLWRHRLLLLALAFGLAALVEGGLDVWGVLYLRAQLALTAAAGAAGYIAGQGLATAARLWLGPRAGRLGGAAGAALGAGTAAAGLALEVFAPVPLATAGLAIAVLGISLCWPLFMSAAGLSGGNLAAVVGGLIAVGYAGFLVGPSLVGWISGAAGRPAGMLILAALAAVSAGAAAIHQRRARLTSS